MAGYVCYQTQNRMAYSINYFIVIIIKSRSDKLKPEFVHELFGADSLEFIFSQGTPIGMRASTESVYT